MQAIFKTLFLGAVLVIGTGPVIAAAPAADPAIGTHVTGVKYDEVLVYDRQ
jgi:hypothetical protein